MKFPCGCVNETDPGSGVTKSISKCAGHKARMGRGGLAYYEELGCLKDGKVTPTNHIKEFKEALELMGAPPLAGYEIDDCLEIGAGVGVYVPWIRGAGFVYEAVEPDEDAAAFITRNYQVPAWPTTLERFAKRTEGKFDLILAAHVLEHLKDSPAAIQLIHDRLNPGGRALLLVPDDTDQVNPDHLWFYSPKTFLTVLQRAGFADIRMVMRRITGRENFIYASAYKA